MHEAEPASLRLGQANESFTVVAHESSHAKKLLLNAKLYAARDVLSCGYSVFLSDLDLVLSSMCV